MMEKEKLIKELTPLVKIQTIDDDAVTRAERVADFILANRKRVSKKYRNALSIAYNIIIRYTPEEKINPRGLKIIKNALTRLT